MALSTDNPLAQWLDLGAKIIGAGEAFATEAQADHGNGPQIVSMALIGRSLDHMRSVLILTRAGMVVDARIIIRSLFENLFVAIGLLDNGQATMLILKANHDASKTKRGKLIAESTEAYSHDEIAQASAYFQGFSKGKLMTASSLVKGTSAQSLYVFYAQLSSDSAHTSFDSLDRYFVKDEAGDLLSIALTPEVDPD